MRKYLAVLLLAAAQLAWAQPSCDASAPWEDWLAFKRHHVEAEGRVVDTSDERLITTSEGQSYALFFALVDNDPALFRRLLRWTEDHLARGDLTAHLPSWLWGRDEQGQWRVLDANTASDSNLWIAYALLEAGRLWQERSYTVLGTLMLQRMAKDEIADVPGLGAMLLPGLWGFEHEYGWRFNPSYLPPQLVERARQALPGGPWAELADNTERLLVSSAPEGIAPDWTTWSDDDEGWRSQGDDDGVGSYDAIRVYLWAGMMHAEAPGAERLKTHFSGIARYLHDGVPSEKIDVATGQASGDGPPGFSAALLPLFQDEPQAQLLRQRLEDIKVDGNRYYDGVLTLFGRGWDEGRFRFDEHGAVLPAWKICR